MPLLPWGSPPTPAATKTRAGKVILGAFCYRALPTGETVVIPAGMVMMQVGDLDKRFGDLDKRFGDIYWVDG